MPQVAVLPSGEMVYLSKDNPYTRTYQEHADSQQYDANYSPDDPHAVPLPHSLLASYQQPLILERMGRIVRLLAMFDLIFALMEVLAHMWPAAICAIMSYCGYVGARMFRRDLTRIYLVYLVFVAVIRISFAVNLVVQSTRGMDMQGNMPASAQVFAAVSGLLQLVITHFVWRFYTLLPTTEEEARFVQFVAEHQASRGLV